MEKIYKYIIDNVTSNKMDKQLGASILKMLKDEGMKAEDDIAIIGVGSMLPFAEDLHEYWENIRNGINCISRFPEKRRKDIDRYVLATGMDEGEEIKYVDGSYIDSIDGFDYKLFRISPREASVMDPYQRVFLQTVWKAIEDSGCGGRKLAGSKTGVFVGYASNAFDSYHKMVLAMEPSLMSIAAIGNIAAIIPSRIAYLLDLRGPTMIIDTACSSSLVAVHQACCSIRNGDCDMAIAGGIKISLIPIDKEYAKMGFESSDGYTRSFDDNSDGTGKGEGVMAVVLKPLSKARRDRDNIYAVIKGSAVNQDGSSMGITAPNPEAQIDVIIKAWEDAGIDPCTLSYIEAHGTGTKLGDPIEIDSLKRAFRRYTDKNQICPIGTVKPTMGHMYECSGMAGLLNVLVALKHREIPPSINFNKPNAGIDFNDSPVYVNTRLRKWEPNGLPMRCAISSFGVSGTNCHMVLEEAPAIKEGPAANFLQVLTLSAKSKEGLVRLIKDYRRFLDKHEDAELGNICYTANTGRGHYNHRLVIVINSLEELKQRLGMLSGAESLERGGDMCFYQEHKIIPGNKEAKSEGDITEAEKYELTGRAKEKVRDFTVTGGESIDKLKDISLLYAEGADVDWEELYRQKDMRKTSLPFYPLENERCWLDAPGSEDSYNREDRADLYYSVNWKTENLKANREKPCGTVLVLADESSQNREIEQGIVSWLREQGREVIEVKTGKRFGKSGVNAYTIENSRNDYIRLIEDIKERKLSQIIHLLTLGGRDEIESAGELKDSQRRTCYSLYYLALAVVKCDLKDNLDVVMVSEYANEVTGEEERIKPENAPLFGFGKAVNKELLMMRCRCLDIDAFTSTAEVIRELECPGKDYIAAYRKGQRYVEEFGTIAAPGLDGGKLEIKEQGAYIITGGTGGIGLEIARFLASKNRVSLALLNRSALPEREKWENILENGEDQGTAGKIRIIQEIERNGSSVECYCVDIADEKAVSLVLDDIRKKHERINGIIHGAGTALDCALAEKEEETFRQIVSPKIYGTWILDRLTRSEDMDFFVMFSSVATIFTMFGQGDYTAANAYMDSFAAYRSMQGRRTLTINWTSWKETGMAARSGFNIDTIFKALPNARGVEGFEKLLSSGEKRALVGELNYDVIGISLLERSGVRLSDGITCKMVVCKKQLKGTKTVSSATTRDDSAEVRLTGRNSGKYTEAEREIAEVCKNILGFGEINVYDNFFEMGADSILLMKIQAEIKKRFPVKITVVDMFEYSTISKLAEYTISRSEGIRTKSVRKISAQKDVRSDIAIIGMAFRFPMAGDVDEFWSNVKNGIDCVTLLPESRQKDVNRYVRFKNFIPMNAVEYDTGAFIEGIDGFDYSYFRMPPKEASLTDPNQRLFLQTAWEAIEDAGYSGKKILGTNTGVYLGFAAMQMYFLWLIRDVEPASQFASLVGNTAAVASGRISYLYDLKGPSMVVDTACSASLAAVHLACRAIRAGDCDMAIAGGVKINLLPVHQKGAPRGIGMESSDGRARTFDDNSDGTGSGEGVAAVLLKPLSKAIEDRDNIYAVIKGSATNQDGSSAGITAPNPAAQEEVIIKAWEDAGIDPETISYIEAHGTGTQLGDPIEIKGIHSAFEKYTGKKQFCAVGSVKTNIAHLSEAAGIAGLIKAVLALRNREIPPSLFMNRPNRKIDFSGSSVYINTVARKWETSGYPRRCGVSGFGMSGTNCHVVLEEYTGAETVDDGSINDDEINVLAISAKSEEALKNLVSSYRAFVNKDRLVALVDLCCTANTGREHYSHRLAVIVTDFEDLKRKIEKLNILGPDGVNEPWAYYGKHKVVSEDRGQKEAGEITEKYRLELCREADRKLEELLASKELDEGLIGGICSLYVQGASVKWDNMYQGKNPKKVSIPAYPFDQKRCWLDIPEYDNTGVDLGVGGQYYADVWVKEGLKGRAVSEELGILLMFKANNEISCELAEGFKNSGREVIAVELGEDYKKNKENSYTITGTQEDYGRLFQDIKNKNLTGIIHLFSTGTRAEISTVKELEESQRRGVYSLFYITKAIAAAGINRDIDTVLVSKYAAGVTGEEERINPWNMTLFGLGKVVKLENSNIMCRCIDIDDFTGADSIADEIIANAGVYHAAYRRGERYIEEVRESDVDYAGDRRIEIRENGVYLITGGTGGMGIEISKYLASRKKVRIALINRSEMPEREKWDEILRTNSRRDQKTIRKVKSIKEIEALGSEVTYYSADVSNMERMKAITDELREKYCRINGIVHAAGLAGGGFLFNKEDRDFNDVLYPKVYGTWVLDRVTREDDIDFFVSFSSIASVFPGKGQGDYAAANAYLDSYAAYRRRQGRKALTINWVAWRDTGMAVEYGVNVDTVFKVLPTPKAMRIFDEVLNKDISRILVGELNYGTEYMVALDNAPVRMSQRMRSSVSQSVERLKVQFEAKQKNIEATLKLKGKGNQEYSEAENRLACIYSQVLGFNEIDIYDNFFEMGGDSVMLSKVHFLLEEQFPGKVKLLDLFEYTSVHKLYKFITGQGSEDVTEEGKVHIEEETREIFEKIEKGSLSIEDVIGNTAGDFEEENSEACSIREDTWRMFEEIAIGNISIEDAISSMKRGNNTETEQEDDEDKAGDDDY